VAALLSKDKYTYNEGLFAMDFNKIINKIRELDAPAKPKVIAESVEVVTEKAKSKAQQKFMGMVYAAKKGEKPASKEVAKAAKGMSKKDAKDYASTKHKGKPEHVKEEEDMKVGDTKKTATGGTVTKTKTGIVHKAGKNYSGEKAEKEEKSKKVDEASKPDYLDFDKDGDKKEPMKKALKDKKKKPFSKVKEGQVNELSTDTLKSYQSKNMDAGRTAMIKGDKKTLDKRTAGKKAVEKKLATKESFTSLLKVVKESKGTKLIEAVDKELFAWAERVAKSKFTESAKADAFAAFTYEKFGGTFRIYDVLNEGK
jgi:hypothetical protein